MTIIELPQGYYRDLTGMSYVEAIAMFEQDDMAFLEKYPSCRPYHAPRWRKFEAPDHQKASWGHEWYRVDEDERLQMHSAQYDSSD